ncbi:MAG: ABC transporter ATP-binding protein [Candidatus Methanomethylicota archaeon]|uniref:ABC transporter ATP-binding protein n=1 Tax=Thermoproteota archaeon TaxID=2056631 RepID=A0A497EQ61_9CREN|nr:MAG: ABC transporter ATP-binding protein [Candidatus Verstraetearchaeota archaeon]
MALLTTVSLRKYFGDVRAVDDVSLSIHEGEYVSIIGPNGAGKTTLINLISGILKPDGGKVYFMDKDITGLSPAKISKLGVARSFQLINIFPELSALDCVCAAIVSRSNKGMIMHKPLANDEEVLREAGEILSLFGLYEKRHVLAKNLPHGDKKLLDIASAFALRPKIILLDEPTSGVSSGEKKRIMDTLMSASREIGIKAVVSVEHDMDIVFSYSSRIIAMHNGKVLADGVPDEIKSNQVVISTITGRGA